MSKAVQKTQWIREIRSTLGCINISTLDSHTGGDYIPGVRGGLDGGSSNSVESTRSRLSNECCWKYDLEGRQASDEGIQGEGSELYYCSLEPTTINVIVLIGY